MLNKKKIKIFYIILFLFFFSETYSAEKHFIIVKINNNIITNSDILNEKNLLVAYNQNLKNLSEEELFVLAKDSLIRQEVKKEEILKYYELNSDSKVLDKFLNDFYLKLNITNDLDLKEFLKKANLTEKEMREKIEIETLWNELVYKKYNDKINIDISVLKQRIKKEINSLKPSKSYFLSEILFNVITKEEINKKNKKILNSITEIGFDNTANIFSISGSAKFGGEIGWIKSNQLSNDVFKVIKNLEIGGFNTEPIIVPGGFLILKINDIKEEKIEVNFDDELKKIINFEKNKQLNQFSQIYYKKVKKNVLINEK